MASNTWERSAREETDGRREGRDRSCDTLIPDGVSSVLRTIERMEMEQGGRRSVLGGTRRTEGNRACNDHARARGTVHSDRAWKRNEREHVQGDARAGESDGKADRK